MTTRRSFLRNVATGSTLLLMGKVLPACSDDDVVKVTTSPMPLSVLMPDEGGGA